MRPAWLFALALIFYSGCLQLPPTLDSKAAELNALHDQFLSTGQLVPDTVNNTEVWGAQLNAFKTQAEQQAFEGKTGFLEFVDVWLNANAMQRTLLQALEGFGTLTRLHTDCSKASAPGKVLDQLKRAREQADALTVKAGNVEEQYAGTASKFGSMQEWKEFASSAKEASKALEERVRANCKTF